MDLLRCVVLVILFRTTTAEDFVFSGDATTWKSAKERCQLAVPDVIFKGDKIKVVDIDVNIDNEGVWVGYYQARTVFEYYGCAEKPGGKKYPIDKENPGHCMSICGAKKRFGIYKKQCFCFGEDELNTVNTTFPFCNKTCHDTNGIVCGGPTGAKGGVTKYISLYRSIEIDDIDSSPIDDHDEKKNCMHYILEKFHWNNCTPSYAPICRNVLGNNSWTATSFGTWIKSTIKCFNNYSRPSSYNNTLSFPTNDSTPELWTGIVRSPVIYNNNNDTSHFRRYSAYGYIIKEGPDIVLKFTNSNDQKKFLCVNGTISPHSSTATSSAPNNSTSSVTKTTTTDAPVCSSFSNTRPITSTTTKPNNHSSSTDQLKSGSSDVGAIVGAILAIVFVVVIVIGVILFLRKRGIQLPFLKKEKQSPTPATVHNNSYVISRPVEILQSTYHSDQDEYAEIDLTTTIDNEANKSVPNGDIEKSNYAHDYLVFEKVEEETYDSTKHDVQKSDPNTFNPYNKLSFEKGSNYDHVGVSAGNAGSKMSDSENTYNTTSLGNSYLKTSADVQNNAYNMPEDPEDTYNHTNIPMRQTGLRDSENDYDAI